MAAVARALLQLLIGLLEGLDALLLAVLALWWRIRATPWPRRGGAVASSAPPAAARATAGGRRPPPPGVVGLILAEPGIADVSLRTVARVAMWCMAYDSIEQLHVYDPSGHLKASQALLEASLQELASQEGRSVLLQSGWSQLSPPGSSGSEAAGGAVGGGSSQQLSKQPPRLWFGTGFANSSGGSGSSNDRTWSMWLSQTMQAGYYTAYSTQRPPVPPSASSHLQAQQKQRQQQQQQQQQHQAQQQQQQAHDTACDIIATPSGGSSSSSRGAAAAAAASGEHRAQQLQTAGDTSMQEQQCREAAAPGAGATRGASCQQPRQQPHVQQVQSPTKQQRSRGSSSGGKAVRIIRLLSAEDAYQPVLAAVLERWPAAAAGVSSPHVANNAAATKAPRQLFGSSSGGEKLAPVAAAGKGRDQAGATSSSSNGTAEVADQGSRGDSSSKTVLQALYSSTSAAAAVVAGAIAPATAGNSSSCRDSGKQQQAQAQSVTSQQEDASMLQELAGVAGRELMQEPQLLLVFGPVLTLAGYPPFHTRVAEVQHVGPLASCRRRDVEAAVATYCQVLQRHGA